MLVAMAVALTGITWRGFLGVGAPVGDELGYRLPLAYREESAVHFPRKPI
jgi:hypothetical protein